MTGIAMFFAFFFLYHTYIQDIIYEERLNQMEEITRQMFQNLEDVIDSHWDRVTEECNYHPVHTHCCFRYKLRS